MFRWKKPIWILLLISLSLAVLAWAAFLVNGDFETGDLTGWASIFTAPGGYATAVSSGTAPYSSLSLPYAGRYSAGLYSAYYPEGSGSGGTGHSYLSEISQTATVPATDTDLEVYVAAVLNGAHFSQQGNVPTYPPDDSYTELDVQDAFGNILYDKIFQYGDPTLNLQPGQSFVDGSACQYMPWTRIRVDLSSYVGQPVTVQYTAYDCEFGGHPSYAYLDNAGFQIPFTPTPSPSISPTFTVSSTSTISPTFSPSPSFSASPTISPTFSITKTGTISPTFSSSPTFSFSPTITPTPSISQTFTNSPSFTASPTITQSFTNSPTFSQTPTYTHTATVTPTPTFTPTFSNSPTITPTFTISPTFSVSPTVTPTASPTVIPGRLLLHLYGNDPNPFGDQGTYIAYFVSVACSVEITVYTVSGEQVRALDPYPATAGDNEELWDGKNQYGNRVASGIFIYRVHAIANDGEEKQDFSKCAVIR